MKISGPRHRDGDFPSSFLLPLLVAVSVFLVSQGLSLPSFANPYTVKLCKLHEVQQTCIVVKNRDKSPQPRIVKTAPFSALCSEAECVDYPTLRVITFDLDPRDATSVFPPAVLPRAPPA